MEPKQDQRKRVLMISYGYPPFGAMSGLRTSKFAKYLPGHGWLPAVLTVSSDKLKWSFSDPSEGVFPDVKVLRASFVDINTFIMELKKKRPAAAAREPTGNDPQSTGKTSRRIKAGDPVLSLLRRIKEWLFFPDNFNLWFPTAFVRGLRELKSARYDAIYSTAPPNTAHVVACALHKATGVPWVADFRDPWSQNEFYAQEVSRTRLLVERWFEKAVLSASSAILTTTSSLAEGLRELHGDRPHGVHCITSGYDPDDYPGYIEPISDRFTITYTGALYDFKRDPTLLLEVVEELIDEGLISPDDIRVRYFGPHEPRLAELMSSLEHPEILEINAVVSRSDALLRQRESAMILVIQWENPFTKKLLPGKIFEHLGAERPVIALTSDGSLLGGLISSTRIGYACTNREQINQALRDSISEFKRNGSLPYRGDAAEIAKYSWHNRAGELAGILNGVSGREGALP